MEIHIMAIDLEIINEITTKAKQEDNRIVGIEGQKEIIDIVMKKIECLRIKYNRYMLSLNGFMIHKLLIN
jgi:hypothetical protein